MWVAWLGRFRFGCFGFRRVLCVSGSVHPSGSVSAVGVGGGRHYPGTPQITEIFEVSLFCCAVSEKASLKSHKSHYFLCVIGTTAAKSSKSLSLAEGVETYEEFKIIKNLGIDLIQGFALHSPQDEEEIVDSLEED